jgi:tyrosyl-tRNA synthetase
MQIPDTIMLKYFELLSDRSIEEIKKYGKSLNSGEVSPRDLKMNLGEEIVTRFHGMDQAKKAKQAYEESAKMLSGKAVGTAGVIGDISIGDWKGDQVEVPLNEWKGGKLWICRLIVIASFAKSNGAARRLIKQGAVRMNGTTVNDEGLEIDITQVPFLLNVGKNKIVKIVVPNEGKSG